MKIKSEDIPKLMEDLESNGFVKGSKLVQARNVELSYATLPLALEFDPSERFWEEWRESKASMKDEGWHVVKDPELGWTAYLELDIELTENEQAAGIVALGVGGLAVLAFLVWLFH